MSLIVQDVRVLEGNWEEIVERAEELKGRRVRVSVLPAVETVESQRKTDLNGDADASENINDTSLMETFSRIGTVSFTPDDVAERSEELWQQGMEAKHGETTS